MSSIFSALLDLVQLAMLATWNDERRIDSTTDLETHTHSLLHRAVYLYLCLRPFQELTSRRRLGYPRRLIMLDLALMPLQLVWSRESRLVRIILEITFVQLLMSL